MPPRRRTLSSALAEQAKPPGTLAAVASKGLARKAATKAPGSVVDKTAKSSTKSPEVAEKNKKARAMSAKKGEKRVRERFTFPAADYELLLQLKKHAASVELPSKKSEVLRAGLHALSKLHKDDFVATVKSVLAAAREPGKKR